MQIQASKAILIFLNLGFGLTLEYWTKSEQYYGFTYTDSFWQEIQFFVLKYFNGTTIGIWEVHFFRDTLYPYGEVRSIQEYISRVLINCHERIPHA